jgi:uncharacterized membrane protein
MRTTAVLICSLLVAALLLAPAVSGTPSTDAPVSPHVANGLGPGSDAAVTTVQSQDVGNASHPESIEIRIQSNGDARFVLSKAFPIATENQSAAFERLASDFENGEYGRLGFETYESVLPAVADHTGRDMEIVDAGPEVSRSENVGRLEYHFTWENFAVVNETGVFVGDAFGTENGLWIDGLSAGQRLVVDAPEGYSVAESPSGPEIDDDALIWTGPTTFRSGDLRVTFEEPGSSATLPMRALLTLLVLVVLGMVAVAGWWVLREGEDRSSDDRIVDVRESLGTIVGDVIPDSSEPDENPTPTAQADEGGTTAVTDAEPSAAADSPEAVATSEDEVDPELLSDEERVENLLEQNGGRMKQATIVSETGWSNAKVSQLLSSMDEEDRVDKLRIGRENLITLPDVDVTDQE